MFTVLFFVCFLFCQNIAFIEPGFYVKLTIDFVVVEYSNGR